MRPMQDDMEDQMEPDEGMPVDEDYIDEVKSGMDNLMPEDFQKLSAKIPTDAEDGETVSMIVTGTAKGGFLTDVYGSELGSGSQEEKPQTGGIRSQIMGGEK